jgi:hypothetical protein
MLLCGKPTLFCKDKYCSKMQTFSLKPWQALVILIGISLFVGSFGTCFGTVASSLDVAVRKASAENAELRAVVSQLRAHVSALEQNDQNLATIRSQTTRFDLNELLRASGTTGNGNLVLECAEAGRLLYRFTCGTGGTTTSTFTGVATCT